jgi:zinc/manganese transport system substrate-binding protein
VLRSADASDPTPEFSWYDIATMRRFSGEIADALIRERPSEAQAIGDRLTRFRAALDGLGRQASEVAANYRDSSVLLSDTRFAPLLRTLALKGVPLAPAAADRAISAHKGVIVIYDAEAPAAAAGHLKSTAEDAGLPVVGLRQSLPSGLHYQTWLAREINAIRGALNEAAP